MQSFFYQGGISDAEIPILRPTIAKGILAELEKVFESGWTGEGEWVYRFERELQQFLHAAHVVTVNSGTSAIDLALDLLNLKAGDTVISTPLTCSATNIPLLKRGIQLRWADVDPANGVTSPASVAANIDHQTKAILVVDLHGVPNYYQELRQLADAYGIPLLADCAQSIGATYAGRQAPAYADICCYSFQSVKSLTTVDGGALAFNHSGYLERATKLRWFGIDRQAKLQSPQPWLYDIEEAGYKYHMNNLAAAIGLSNLGHLAAIVRHQQTVAAAYQESIENTARLQKFEYTPRQTSSFWVYPLLAADRNHFISYLRAAGIEATPLHQANTRLSAFARSGLTLPSRDGLAGVEWIDAHLVCLPTGHWVDAFRLEKIIQAMKGYCSPA